MREKKKKERADWNQKKKEQKGQVPIYYYKGGEIFSHKIHPLNKKR